MPSPARSRVNRRFTPRMGKGTRSTQGRRGLAVHPHACGERAAAARWRHLHAGSPPRTWGKVDGHSSTMWSAEVHPHVRGERIALPAGVTRFLGSPPRTWGKAVQRNPGLDIHRFTPTYVGKGHMRIVTTTFSSVHPHVRGERTFCKLLISLAFCNANFATGEIPLIIIPRTRSG